MRLLRVQFVAQCLDIHACSVCKLRHVVAQCESAAGFIEVWMFGNLIIKHVSLLESSHN
ncbi:Uncharacterised protein [Enterobacter cloacae]|nr:Uncharacterised protein [Enterobacter cloacae]